MYRKIQSSSNVVVSIPLIKRDGSQAVGLDLGTLSTKIVGPTGAAVVGYTEADFTEPNGDGVYCINFSSVAAVPAFTLEDQPNPYTLTLDSSVADVEPFTVDIWIVSQYVWELSLQSTVDTIEGSISHLSVIRRIATTLPQQIFRPSVGDKYVKVDVLLYDGAGAQFDPPDNTNYNARIDVLSVDGSGTILTSQLVLGYEGKGYTPGYSISDATVLSGTAGGSGASFTVDTVDGNGAILTYSMVSGGVSYNADNVLRSSSHRPNYDYDGLGFISSSETGTHFNCYKDNVGTELDHVAICHHSAQANQPQHIIRMSTGVYYFWVKVSSDTTLQSIHFQFSWFDLVGDTTTHLKELYQMTIADSSVIDAIKEDTTQIISDIAALPTATDMVTELMGKVVEGTITFQELLSIYTAVLAGKSSGGGTANLKFRDLGDTKDRISATVDSDGNRLTITLDLS